MNKSLFLYIPAIRRPPMHNTPAVFIALSRNVLQFMRRATRRYVAPTTPSTVRYRIHIVPAVKARKQTNSQQLEPVQSFFFINS
jgi:hypothetical protein